MQGSRLSLALGFALVACGDGDASVDAGTRDGGRPWWLDGGPPATDGGPGTADAAEPDSGFPAAAPGLVRLAQVEHPRPGPHLVEVTPWNDVVYVANSFDELTALVLEPGGGLLMTLVRPAVEDMGRCISLAIHEPSRTMYCSAEEPPSLRAYDLTDPEVPVTRTSTALGPGQALRTRDIAVVGDHLYIAAFDQGLRVAPIGPGGVLGPAVTTSVAANVRFIGGDGPIALLSSDRGLLVLDGTGPSVTVARELRLDGTPQDLSVRGDRAVVALGSAGAAIVDLSADPLRVTTRVQPLAVATGADVDGDALAVTTLTGVYLYDLALDPPRLSGFVSAGRTRERNQGVMLNGRFHRGELLVSDWIFIERYAVDRTGHVLEPDLARGVYVRPDAAAVRIPARNEGDVTLEVTGFGRGEPIVLGPGESGALTIPLPEVPLLPWDEGRGAWMLEVRYRPVSRGAVGGMTQVALVVRDPADDPPRNRPAPGDPFPTIAVADITSAVSHLPAAGQRAYLTFYTPDCAAMWPVLEDLAYLTRTGALEDHATAVFLSQHNTERDGYVARWNLVGPLHRHHGYLAPPAVVVENGSKTLYDRFVHHALGSAAAHPTDYLVDALGRVVTVETFYRGAHPLR